jgi:hypothetical protein
MTTTRVFLAFVLLSVSLRSQSISLGMLTPAPPAVTNVSATWSGASGGTTSIYYYVVARYRAGWVLPLSRATASGTLGIAALGGGNAVTLRWDAAPGATGYDVVRVSGPPFSPYCSSCAVVINTSATSLVDSSSSTVGDYPPAGFFLAASVSGVEYIDQTSQSNPALAMNIAGVTSFPVSFTGIGSGVLPSVTAGHAGIIYVVHNAPTESGCPSGAVPGSPGAKDSYCATFDNVHYHGFIVTDDLGNTSIPKGLQLAPVKVSALAGCSASANLGMLKEVNDASAPTWGSTVMGGGAVLALVMCDGTNWKVH